MYREVMKWLRIQSMPVAENHLRLRLESHPDYPSLLAVKDTLDELGIESYACKGTKEELKKEGKPFLAHFNMGEGHVQFFKDVATAEQKVKDFDKYWSGYVMFVEATKNYGNADHDKQHKKEKRNMTFGIAAIVLFTGALLGLSIATGSLPALLLIIFNTIGLYFSWLIIQKEFGISNIVSDKICSLAKHSRCESILFSKGAKLFYWLTWGDIGMTYFATSLLYLLVSLLPYQPVNFTFCYLLCFGGLLFPIYSLYYQWRIVKQWCMLCIGVLAVLFLNAAAGIIFLQKPVALNETILYAALLFSVLIGIIFLAWQLLLTLYAKSRLSISNEIKATGLKRNPEIFNALLLKQKVDPINLPEHDEAIRFGDPAAQYQLVIACNPYCVPCAKVHQAIEQLFAKYPDRLSVSIRFALDKNDDSKKVVTAKEIMKVAKTNPLESVKDWYNIFNLEKFKELHHTNGELVDQAVDKHIAWSKAVYIKATPTIFVNGRRLPELYSWVDFVETVEYEIKN